MSVSDKRIAMNTPTLITKVLFPRQREDVLHRHRLLNRLYDLVDCKVIVINDQGKVIEFAMNDRCAAGTGRFFEAMARVLGCGIEGISSSSNVSDSPAVITSQCSVFAESEVVSLINEGQDLAEVITGINNAIAGRIVSMAKRIGIINDLAVTGGCAKNEGLIMAFERKNGVRVTSLPMDPQLIGAVGAALFASERGKK